jgi:predicted dehydrogenase
LARLAGEAGVRSMVGYNRRFYSVFHQGIEVIRQHGPLLGLLIEGHERIDAVRAAGRQPDAVLRGWIYANATHTIDLLRFFGGEVDEMHCLAHRRREPLGDQFAAIMNFDSGALGEYSAHWLSPGGWRVMLSGQGVTVEFKPLEAGVWIDAKGQRHEIAPSEADQRCKPGFHGQMAAFCRLVRGEDPGWPAQDLAGAHRTMLLAERMTAAVADRPQGAGK